MTAVRLGGDAGLGRIISPFLSQLVAGLDGLSGPAGTRLVHNVFLEQGMTVSTYVRSRRLERCHQDLVDPAQRYTLVAVIGARSGFTDAAHFSLTFKAAHTESPAALRRRGRGDG